MGRAVMDAPAPFVEVRARGNVAWVRPEARAWVEENLDRGLTLHQAAGREAGRESILEGGRGPAFVRRSEAGEWVVRHGYRGGAVARFLGDRHLRLGPPRPFRETVVSQEVRRRGIPTPRVVAAAVYPAGLFRRGDVVTELVAGARSIGDLLFGDRRARDEAFRRRLLEATARVPGRLAGAGIRHSDLNVENLVVPGDSPGMGPVLLDLDRCRVGPDPDPAYGRKMADRLDRSLRRGEERRGPPLTPEEWAAFRALNTSRSEEAPSSPP